LTETLIPPVTAEPGIKAAARNVLVVDDDEAVRELMAYVLESEGYNVFKANHSTDAMFLHIDFAGTFHLLLTDICMKPHADGFALARAVRRDRPDIKVIFASGYVDHIKLQNEMKGAPARFIAKPFTPADLVECVRAALSVDAPGVPAPA
jgi:DNA-binding NtrC family response regulator